MYKNVWENCGKLMVPKSEKPDKHWAFAAFDQPCRGR